MASDCAWVARDCADEAMLTADVASAALWFAVTTAALEFVFAVATKVAELLLVTTAAAESDTACADAALLALAVAIAVALEA